MECLPPWERTAEDRALNNPVILTEILKLAPLKDCRLVCHFWNDVVLSLPNTRLALMVIRPDDGYEAAPFYRLCRALDARLAKRINFNRDEDSPPFDYRLLHLCEKFIDRVEILDFLIFHEDSLKAICQVLQNYCPNLKQLRIKGDFLDPVRLNLFARGEERILPVKPNLTLFALICCNSQPEIQFFKDLANFIQLVVNASPNLREVTIPWGFYPDFANSMGLESLNISLTEVSPSQIVDTRNISKLSGMLHQVADQLVSLCFGTDEVLLVQDEGEYDFDNSPEIGFHLSRKMLKLRKFCTRIVKMWRCADFMQTIEMMPFLETLVIGREDDEGASVDEILEEICNARKVFTSVRKLEIINLYEPGLLDGLGTAFPNVEKFEMICLLGTDFEWDNIFDMLQGWEGVKHLKVTLSQSHVDEVMYFVRGLLQGRELFQRLTSLKIKTCLWKDMEFLMSRDLTEDELASFKQMLLDMDRMDHVTIAGLDINTESVNIIMDCIASKKMAVSKY